MIAKREEARRKRELEEEESQSHHPLDAMMAEVEMERKRKAHPSLQWKSSVPRPNNQKQSSSSLYTKRQKRVVAMDRNRRVKSLFQLCVDLIVEHFDCVESLGDVVDSSVRRAIASELVAQHKLNREALVALTVPGMETLELCDCAGLNQTDLAQTLQKLLPRGLRCLLLHHAGRCFGPHTIRTILPNNNTTNTKPPPTPQLMALSIAGAYLLQDKDAAQLVGFLSKTLTSIEFKACPLLASAFCASIQENYALRCAGTLLELSLEDLFLSKESLLSLGTPALNNIKSLRLRQIEAVDDEVVLRLLDNVQHAEGLDFGYNHKLTDASLSAIRSCNETGALVSLELCGLKNITDVGLETLFTEGLAGLPHPPRLRKLNLSSCDGQAVTDTVIDLACRASGTTSLSSSTTTGTTTKSAVESSQPFSPPSSSSRGLVYLGIHGSLGCTNDSMESLAATAAHSIRELDVGFVPHITNQGLGYLVSKASHQLTKIHIWGCAQITEEFLDGHARCDDPTLEIIGAWMKKAS